MAVSELPGNPNNVWTVKTNADDDYDTYIIVSFINATLVLSIGETVEEITDSGFLGKFFLFMTSSVVNKTHLVVYFRFKVYRK